MPRINWPRLIIGGIIASIICFLTDGFFHEKVVVADWAAVYANLGVTEPKHNAAGLIYFAVFELGRRCGPVQRYLRVGSIPKT